MRRLRAPLHEGGEPARAQGVQPHQRLDADQLDFLARLPLTHERGDLLFVHANADDPAGWAYVEGKTEAVRSLQATRQRITFCGHMHEPMLYHLSATGRSGSFVPVAGEAIPFGDGEFDTVVCTFTLCSVGDQARTLEELRRILKPGGRLLYAEHGRAPDAGVQKWQDRIEPVWKRLAGGCHLTRPVTAAIAAAGFQAHEAGERYTPKMPRWAGWMEWGEAVKAG